MIDSLLVIDEFPVLRDSYQSVSVCVSIVVLHC